VCVPTRGVLPIEHESALDSLSLPAEGEEFDAVYRIGYPHDFSRYGTCPTFVFATCDRMVAQDGDWRPDGHGIGDTINSSGVTVITPSQWCRAGLLKSGVDPARVVVVPHGVDTDVFRSIPDRDERRSVAGLDGRFVFLHVGAMTGNKNLRGLLRAFIGVVRRHPHAVLLLKGLDEIYSSSMWLENELNLLAPAERALVEPNIIYIGDVLSTLDQALLYQMADAYVAPYQSEGFNMPALEAAACGCPLVLTAGGATDDFTTPAFCLSIPSELGDHDRDGSMWLRTHPDQIEALMDRLVSDDEFRASASLAAPLHVRDEYCWRSVVDRLLGVVAAEVCV
jgi:glycosyltransferase involved in cell wall biosynthesis